jgi:uncharacterized membrane protein
MNMRATPATPTVQFDAETIVQATQAVDLDEKAKPLWYKVVTRFSGIAIVIAVIAPFVPALIRWVRASQVALTFPDLSVLARVPLAVQIHLATVLICVPLGAYILSGTKGNMQHKMWGRLWVAAMFVTCISALFIKSFAPVIGPFGVIHLMVLWSLFNLSKGMYAIIWKRDLQGHLRNMQGAYWGLIIAGLFSFIPGRMLWAMFTTM